ncbi:MAG: acyltransferase [Methanoregula sp.]|nr:acyltransferase [Methanoregula sp.]
MGKYTSELMGNVRLLFMDNLKILLAVNVIFLHAGQPYGPGGDWFISQPAAIPLVNIIIIGIFFGLSSSYFMGLFFFISAYFLPGSYDRKGAIRFLTQRMIRLGIPLLVCVTTIIPVLGYVFYNPSAVPFIEYYPGFFSLRQFGFGYLWFVVLLAAIALVYTGIRTLLPAVAVLPFPKNTGIIAAALLLGTFSFIIRIWFPINTWVLLHSFEPAHLPQYLLLSAAGVLAYRNNWLEAIPSSIARFYGAVLSLAIILLFPMFLIFGEGISAGGPTPANLFYSFWEAFVGISICICLVIFFRDRICRSGRVRSVLAENVFPVYLIHLPVVVALQWFLIPVGIPSLLKFFLAGGAGVLCCFGISNYLVRKIPYAEKIIF